MAYNLGLVLSGGGIKGMAHLGVLKYLDEINVKVEVIAGTSAGALVGSLYAAGNTPDEIVSIANDIYESVRKNPLKYSLVFGRGGLIDTEKVATLLEKHLAQRSLNGSSIDILSFSTELKSGTLRVDSDVSCVKTHAQNVMASAAYPFVFSPIKTSNGVYSDGGILAHFPAEIAKSECHYLIGSYVSPLNEVTEDELQSATSIAIRSISLSAIALERENFQFCDVLIHPDKLKDYSTFELSKSKAMEIFNIGYEEAKKHHSKIMAISELAEEKSMSTTLYA